MSNMSSNNEENINIKNVHQASAKVDVKNCNKLAYKIVQAFIVLLILMVLVKVRIPAKIIMGITILIFTSIATTVANILIKNEINKGIALLIIPGITGNLFSVLMGGSSVTFLVNFAIMGIALLYFDAKMFIKIVGVVTSYVTILTLIYPPTVEGPGGALKEAIIKIALLNITAIIFRQVIDIGDKINRNSYENLMNIEAINEKSSEAAKVFSESLLETKSFSNNIINNADGIGGEVSGIIKDVADMDSGIEKMNASVKKVESLINDNTQVSTELRKKYIEVVNEVNKGMKDIQETLLAMENMGKAVEDAYGITNALVTYMEEIDKILENIMNVVGQTKLLALNASIESARAGDKGKGFDVVAEEIRALSDESNRASGNIKEIIELLNETVSETSKQIKEGLKVSKKGSVEISKITDVLKSINDTSVIVEDVIVKEGKVVENIKNEFDNVSNKMSWLKELANKNITSLGEVEYTISLQGELMKEYGRKLENIKELANEMMMEN